MVSNSNWHHDDTGLVERLNNEMMGNGFKATT